VFVRAFIRISIIILLFVLGTASGEVPEMVPITAKSTVFLTWQDDPCTTMTVQWLVRGPLPLLPAIEVRLKDSEAWAEREADISHLPNTDIKFGRVQLTGLLPDTEYSFRFTGDTEVYHFKTMPLTLTSPLQFISGGDASVTEHTVMIADQAAATEPMFVVLGGDTTYDQGLMSERVVNFIQHWHRHMVTPGGRLIPLLCAIGNHEVNGGYGGDYSDATFFYTLFSIFDHHGAYAALDFGDYMSLILLDTAHTADVEGPQTDWLKQALETRTDRPHLFAVYHLPAYPSHRPSDHLAAPKIREQWVPLFERYGVDVVFEHHDHTYKRTVRILNRKPNPKGVLYLGDGGWGKSSRKPVPAETRWYLAKTVQTFHFIQTTLDGPCRSHRAINEQGQVIDSVEADVSCRKDASQTGSGH
jgi:hypothetical protein